MNILIPGGCGYLGSQLTVHLLADGHRIYINDPGWFGCSLPDNERVTKVDTVPTDTDYVIYLAGLTNDSECEKHPEKALEMNVVAFRTFLEAYDGPMIFLSSVAAYGDSETHLRETAPLKPTTPYGRYKALCEEMLKDKTILRPAGVFGYSARMRFDLTVNRMVRDAFCQGKIHVHGGSQYRPHVHIRDLINTIRYFLTAKKTGVYNVVHDNQTVLETAQAVQSVIPCEIVVEERQDQRSYKVSGEKLKRLGIVCGRTIEPEVQDLLARFKEGYWKDAYSERSMNVVSF